MVIKIGINGFGRIGRIIFRSCLERTDLQVVAINDPAINRQYICYLIKFDSTHGKFKGEIKIVDNKILVNGSLIETYQQKQPAAIPWWETDVEYVIESSGMFTSVDKASGHLENDAVKRVILTAPSADVPMIILGVNQENLTPDMKVISCASSTLYCLAPIIKVLEDNFGISEGFVTSVHAMTPSLKPLDGLCVKGKHWRDHRSIHQNIIPATTGACRALGKIYPQVKDKLLGIAFRVPIVNVSVLDISIRLSTDTNISEIIKGIAKASQSSMKNIINTCTDEAVSSDFIGDQYSCTLDISSSLQLKPNFYKLVCWYENEYSYACRIIDTIHFCELQFKRTKLKSELLRKSSTIFIRQRKLHQNQSANNISQKFVTTIMSPMRFCASHSNKINQGNEITKKTSDNHHNVNPSDTSIFDNKNEVRPKAMLKRQLSPKQSNITGNVTSIFRYHSKYGQQEINISDYVKAQERLEKVKSDVSKMVTITEELLKKSFNNRSNNANKTNTVIEKEVVKVEEKLNANGVENIASLNNEVKTIIADEKFNEDKGSDSKTSSVGTLNSKITRYRSKDDNISYNSSEKDLSMLQFRESELSYQQKCSKHNVGKICEGFFNVKGTSEILAVKNRQKMLKRRLSEMSTSRNTGDQELKKSDDLLENIEAVNKERCTYEEVEITNQELVVNNKSNIAKEVLTEENLCHIRMLKKENICTLETGRECCSKVNNNHDIPPESTKENVSLKDNIQCNKNYKPSCKYTNKETSMHSNKSSTHVVLAGFTCSERKFETKPTVSVKRNSFHQQYNKQNIYDKLDSMSATDSENSFQINERKSQVINLMELSSSLEDLSRLDQICRIIEISDELSDRLLSPLNNERRDRHIVNWSFKEFCDKINLDEFCKNVFGNNTI